MNHIKFEAKLDPSRDRPLERMMHSPFCATVSPTVLSPGRSGRDVAKDEGCRELDLTNLRIKNT